MPETSQTASAAAKASRPTVEDEKTRLTVWSMPAKTWGRTFGLISGAIVDRQSRSWWVAPRMPSMKSEHATPAMNVRSAIALA